MTVVKDTPHLHLFKLKIEEAINYVPKMPAVEKLKAVQFWNEISEKLQEVVNNCTADINEIALSLQENASDIITRESNNFRPVKSIPICNISSDFVNFSPSYVEYNGMAESYHTTHISTGSLLTSEASHHRESAKFNSSIDIAFIHHFDNTINSCESISDNYIPLESISQNSCDILETEPCEVSNSKTHESSTNVNSNSKEITDGGNIQTCQSYEVIKNISSVVYSRSNSPLQSSQEHLNSNTQSGRSPEIKSKKKLRTSSKNKKKMKKESSCDISYVCGNSVDCIKSDSETSVKSGESESNCVKPIVSFVVSSSEEILAKNELTSESVDDPVDSKKVTSKSYNCSDCTAKFSTKTNLTVHTRRHTGEKPYACSKCPARFTTKGNLKRHLKTHTGEKPYECTNCGSKFTEKKSLTIHMRRHTGEKPYECKECGKRFAQSSILQTHLAMHLNLKFHLCEHCGKSFRQRSQLETHKLRHANIRNYSCDSCPSRFLTKGDLERHIRSHTGERPYVCHLCSKSYTRQQSLNEHYNRHYGRRPYSCKYCSKTFIEMSACHKHIKQHERTSTNSSSHLSTDSSSIEPPKQQDSSQMDSNSSSCKLVKLSHCESPKLETNELTEVNDENVEANQSLATFIENYFQE